MRAWLLRLIVVASAFCGDSVMAQPRVIPEHPKFVFPTRPEVSVKLTKASNGKPVRGKLISLTALEAVIDTGALSRRDRERGELGQRLSVDRMESLRSTDGRFQLTPEEDFQVVARRIVAAYSSVKIEGEVDPGGSGLKIDSPLSALPGSSSLPGSAALPGMAKPGSKDTAEATKPKNTKPKPNGMGSGGFGGIKNLPKPKKPESESTGEDDAVETPSEISEAPPETSLSGVTETLYCSSCTKEIPSSAIKSGVCPHCKVPFANISIAPSAVVKNPFEKSGGAGNAGASNTGGGAFSPTETTPSTAPLPGGANNSGTVVVQDSGFTFESIPGWAKGGLFILLVLVGYHMLFNR